MPPSCMIKYGESPDMIQEFLHPLYKIDKPIKEKNIKDVRSNNFVWLNWNVL